MESTKVERRGCGTVGDLGIWDDKFIEPLSRLAAFIKQQNAVAGMVSSVNGIPYVAAPSLGVALYGLALPLPFVAMGVLMLGLAVWIGLGSRAPSRRWP